MWLAGFGPTDRHGIVAGQQVKQKWHKNIQKWCKSNSWIRFPFQHGEAVIRMAGAIRKYKTHHEPTKSIFVYCTWYFRCFILSLHISCLPDFAPQKYISTQRKHVTERRWLKHPKESYRYKPYRGKNRGQRYRKRFFWTYFFINSWKG